MDVQKYKILYKEGEAEISEKKSRSTGIHREDKKTILGCKA